MKKSNVLPISNKNDYRGIFRERIEKLRTDNKLDIKDMCKRIHCSPRLYSSWINGNYNSASGKTTYTFPSIDKLMNICDAFGVSLDWLMGRTDYTTIDNQEISKITGLNDTSIESLKSLNYNSIVTEKMKLIAYGMSGHSYFNIMLTPLDILNFLLNNLEHFKRFAKAFINFAMPGMFTTPVHWNTKGCNFEKSTSETGEPSLIIANPSRYDDNISFEMNDTTIKAISKNQIDIIVNDLGAKLDLYVFEQNDKKIKAFQNKTKK